MARIIFELDAIEDLKTRLDSLIQRGQKIDSTDFKKLVRQRTGFLDKKEKMVFRCIEEKPGQSKQDLVNYFNRTYQQKRLYREDRSSMLLQVC